jgi:HAD superfamily phosphoserine phosphatase-like hydrolase
VIGATARPFWRLLEDRMSGTVHRLSGAGVLSAPEWPPSPGDPLVSVVIPVLNESRRIQSVVRLALQSGRVGEVLVIDDGSIDGTPELAEAAGARVLTSTLLGKGASMEDGLRAARHATLLFLDGDLSGLQEDLIERMTSPILQGWADFVKARFARREGRVTMLTARPLLRTYFPELAHIEQPLGGIVAARRELLERLRFENDFGVDVGLLIDAAAMGARIAETDVGSLEHESQDLQALGEMAMQVIRAILERAAAHGRLRLSFARQAYEKDRVRKAGLEDTLRRVGDVERLALFDMDGTLLQGRFIVELARRTEREQPLQQYLDRYDLSPVVRTRRIARLFRGVPREVFERTARELPLTPGAVETVVGLRKRGYRVAVVTDSYHVAAETVRRRVFADLAVANILEFRKDRATGAVTLAPTMQADRQGPMAYDKLNTLRFLVRRMGIRAKDVLAVGDGENDVGMLRAAGVSVAFQPKSDRVRKAAKQVVLGRLDEVLGLL